MNNQETEIEEKARYLIDIFGKDLAILVCAEILAMPMENNSVIDEDFWYQVKNKIEES